MDIGCYFCEGAQVTQETQGAFFPSSNQASSKMLPLLQACPVTLAVLSELIPASTGGGNPEAETWVSVRPAHSGSLLVWV